MIESTGGRRDPRHVFYPEVGAGGFSRVDGTIEFYTRVNALLSPSFTVLDFGAGRGVATEDAVAYRRALQTLRGKVRAVVGVDVDPVVLTNPLLDRAFAVRPGDPIPLADGSVDLVLSDHTFEHLTEPAAAAAEFRRVLRPGGWLCARTPNKWGYIGLGARLIPNRLHARVLRRVQAERQEQDVFPTVYRLNTLGEVRRRFPPARWDDFSYAHTSEPHYVGRSMILWGTMLAGFRLVPASLGATLMLFLRKRG